MIPEHFLFIDIETLPTDRTDFIAEAEASVKCPASYKKEESISEWWATEGEAARRAAVHKTCFEGGLGRLAAISWGWGAEPIVSAHTAVDGLHSVDRERAIISGFFAECEAVHERTGVAPTIVGHWVTGFDIRWIWHRAIVAGITPPWWWPVNAKPWDQDTVQDTALMWAGPRDKISMDRLARILGIEGKTDMDGSQVWEQWEAGEHERIRLYCADDVRCVREIWCRLTGEDAPDDELDEVIQPVAEVAPVQDKLVVDRTRVVPPFLEDVVASRGRAA